MTRAEAVAADTNILRHPTPRRYLTALEELRGRRIAILPMVDHELQVQLDLQAADHVRGRCRQKGLRHEKDIDAAAEAANTTAGQMT